MLTLSWSTSIASSDIAPSCLYPTPINYSCDCYVSMFLLMYPFLALVPWKSCNHGNISSSHPSLFISCSKACQCFCPSHLNVSHQSASLHLILATDSVAPILMTTVIQIILCTYSLIVAYCYSYKQVILCVAEVISYRHSFSWNQTWVQ